ncbi:MAG: periplasmic heavy metal sensor [bacterium]|nr:periplasmic heavy metal sensor [bacterium]
MFTKQRLNASIIALLIVLNVTSLGTIWFLQSRQSPGTEVQGPGPVRNFLERELDLTQEQAQQFEILRQEHFQESKAISEDIHPLKETIMQEVFAASPDSATVKAFAEEIGAKQAELEELRFQHFLALKSVCRPEQLETFQALFRELFPPQNHPNEGRPPPPGSAPPPGPAPGHDRAPGAEAPREAVEACQRKSQGDTCQFTVPHGRMTGVCRPVGPQLACVPEDDGMKKPFVSP